MLTKTFSIYLILFKKKDCFKFSTLATFSVFLVLFFSSGFLLVCWSHRERKGKNSLKPEEN